MSTLQRDPRDRVQVLDEEGNVVEVGHVGAVDDPSVVVEHLHSVPRVTLQRTHNSLHRMERTSEAETIVLT